MSSTQSYYDLRVSQFLNSRSEVTNTYYTCLLLLTISLAVAQALIGGFYGAEQGVGFFKKLLTTFIFFVGDLILVALAHMLFPPALSKFFATLALIGFCILSIFASTAFLIGQQQSQSNYIVEAQKDQIADLQKSRDALPSSWHLNRKNYDSQIAQLQAQLSKNIAEHGDQNSSNAIYFWIAKITKTDVESVSLIVRSSWSIVFVLGSLALGGMLKTVYAPRSLEQYNKHLARHSTALQLGKLQNSKQPISSKNQQKTGKMRSAPLPSSVSKSNQESGADAQKKEVEYHLLAKIEQIKSAVGAGKIRPSQRELKKAGLGSDLSVQLLRNWLEEGFLARDGQGYKVA
jgi:hypothetical protein